MRVMSLYHLMENWRPGSEDEPWNWENEYNTLLYSPDHYARTNHLIKEIQENGIYDPVLLGHDGRVWDGHHRIVVACLLGYTHIPVDVVGEEEEVEARPLAFAGLHVCFSDDDVEYEYEQ